MEEEWEEEEEVEKKEKVEEEEEEEDDEKVEEEEEDDEKVEEEEEDDEKVEEEDDEKVEEEEEEEEELSEIGTLIPLKLYSLLVSKQLTSKFKKKIGVGFISGCVIVTGKLESGVSQEKTLRPIPFRARWFFLGCQLSRKCFRNGEL